MIDKILKIKPNCTICTMHNIVFDWYPEIDLPNLKLLLAKFGFKIGYEIPFTHKQYHLSKREDYFVEEIQLFAYNLEKKHLVMAETFTYAEDDADAKTMYREHTFNSIDYYMPVASNAGLDRSCQIQGGGHGVSNLMFRKIGEMPFHHFGERKPPHDFYAETPFICAYDEHHNVEETEKILQQRIGLCNPEIMTIFRGNRQMEKIFKNLGWV